MNPIPGKFFAAAALVASALAIAPAAHAGGNVYFSVGVQPAAPVYVDPAPVYVQPQPVYVQPQPVYVEPAPVYVRPRPVFVQPPVVYGRPQYYAAPGWRGREGGWDRDGWRRAEWRRHGWEHHHDHDD